MTKIVTTNLFPPIPDRSHDWGAYYEGEDENGYKGFGATEVEAIRDLVANHETPFERELIAALEAGRKMRDTQRAYFRGRTKPLLTDALEAEIVFDRLVRAIFPVTPA